MANEIEVAEYVVHLLEEGNFSSTYKQAVLLGLIDLCRIQSDEHGHPPTCVTTRQLADRVIELYWPQTRTHSHALGPTVLTQNQGRTSDTGQARIVSMIVKFRAAAEKSPQFPRTLAQAKILYHFDYEVLVREVEWTLIQMPLPKLQRTGGKDTEWLYTIGWDDKALKPAKSDVRAYQNGSTSACFDNQIRFRPGVAEAFVRLAAILRPFIQQHWVAKVAALNHMPEARLPAFMFGIDRISLEPVRDALAQLQQGLCFYCQERLNDKFEVDHFVPWARQPENGIHNLVVTHKECNISKRDFLASSHHLHRWRARLTKDGEALADIAQKANWEDGRDRVLNIVRSLYLRMPSDSRLWRQRNEFETIEPYCIAHILSHAPS